MVVRNLAVAAAVTYVVETRVPQYSLGPWTTGIAVFFAYFFLVRTWRVILYPRFFSPLRHLPRPPNGHWLLGHTRRIIKDPSGMPMQEWVNTVPNDGLMVYSTFFEDRVLLTSPKALGEVLVSKNYDFEKPKQFTDNLKHVLGLGILFAEGDEHKRQRKALMPAFAFRHIKDLYPIFWSKSQEMVQALSTAIKGQSGADEKTKSTDGADSNDAKHAPDAVEVSDWVSRATLDIIGVSGMDRDFNAISDPSSKLNETYKTLFNPGKIGNLIGLLAIFIPISLLRMLPVKRNKDVKQASKYIKQVCRDLITEKRQRLNSEKHFADSNVDIISVALESGGFRDEELVNQMMTFLVAGHETTATAMVWSMYLLCKHPEVQQKLRDEIRSNISSLDSEITAADIDNCHYLQAVCNEILRVWAPVPLTMRIAAKNTSILGQYIPKGTRVILCPYAVNMSEELWGADAKEFKPERWLDANGRTNNRGSADSNYSFLTFLHGPRSCIGQKFAQAEFACILAAWVGNFKTTFEDGGVMAEGKDLEIAGGVTAKPKGGVWVQLEKV